jgi:hypothetical protein
MRSVGLDANDQFLTVLEWLHLDLMILYPVSPPLPLQRWPITLAQQPVGACPHHIRNLGSQFAFVGGACSRVVLVRADQVWERFLEETEKCLSLQQYAVAVIAMMEMSAQLRNLHLPWLRSRGGVVPTAVS